MLTRSRLAVQKPHLLKIARSPERSFVVKGDAIAWNNPWHFHPELEILYCIKGKGTNFVGNYIAPIEEGELLMFGKNLPHTRQRDKEYYLQHNEEVPSSIVIQFSEDFLGERFFSVKELYPIQQLLHNAQRGIKFSGSAREEITLRMEKIGAMEGAEALIELLHILNIMSLSKEFFYLNPARYVVEVNDTDIQKINRIYAYTAERYTANISLAEIANLANLTPSAFCKYFKARTRKSYIQFLAEFRISRACEMLMEGDKDVKEVCFEVGFNNISHFHKLFKRIVQATPLEYREKARNKIPFSNS